MRRGGERRGNAQDRARRRAWLLVTFDVDLGPEVARCHLGIAEGCLRVLDAQTLTTDRIQPGGTYARHNIQPACAPCQNLQGARLKHERHHTMHRAGNIGEPQRTIEAPEPEPEHAPEPVTVPEHEPVSA